MIMLDKRIIYLESEDSFITSLGDVLKELNYYLEITRNVSMAEKAAVESEPNLFIVSMDIASSDPTEFVKTLRSKKPFSVMPFIFISKTFDEETFFTEFREFKKQNSFFIKKPFDAIDVVDIIEEAIGLPTPPKGVFPVSLDSQRELLTLKKQNEELKSEISESSKFKDQSKGQVEEKKAYIKELKLAIETGEKEKNSTEEELKLVKDDLYSKNKSIEDKERKIEELKIKNENEEKKLKSEIAELKKEFDEDKKKHKKAQQALREFYKPKLANVSTLEKELEKTKDAANKLKDIENELNSKRGKIDDLEKELKKELVFREKMKKMMSDS